MKKKILVIGATGLTGQAVTKKLHIEGHHVIVLSRSREKAKNIFKNDLEVVEGDVLKPETIRYAFSGVDGVFISLPERDVPASINTILKYSQESGVQQVVYTSGCTVKKENAWHPMIYGHYQGESAIESSGLPYTILRLTMVMDMIPRYANNGKPFIIGKQPHGWSWIHSSDIGAMAAAAFTSADALNKKFTLFGTEKSTIADAVTLYNANMGYGEKVVKPRPYWLAKILALFIGENLKYAIKIFKYFEDHPEEGNPSITYSILGKPQMTLARFMEQEKTIHGIK